MQFNESQVSPMGNEAEQYAGEILRHPRFLQLQTFVHHGEINSVYDHSLAVAEAAYKLARWMRLSEDETASVIRAALLHDFFGYDWHGERFKKYVHHFGGIKRLTHNHAFVHGPIAASRAKQFFGLSDSECDAIRRHMFPLAAMPRTKLAWIITIADKAVASKEVLAAAKYYILTFCHKAFA